MKTCNMMVLTTEEMTKNGRGIYRLEICVKCRTQQKQSGLGAESPENSFSDKLRVSENTILDPLLGEACIYCCESSVTKNIQIGA